MTEARLGHYVLIQKLGSGGMGDVYLAQDEKLQRRVALKVLAADLAGNPERRARFEREAMAVAALNHPNIVTIHSVERDGDTHFITMELVEGATLTQVIPETGLALDRLFDLAIPALEAVSTAHEKGIIHRDLKPDNIMVNQLGHVKVLDFGLAKLTEEDGQADQTVAGAKTEAGRIMGTAAYMSPEQAEGKPVDARTDIFSMGVILYEMATGKRPFQGESNLSTLTALLRDHPAPVTEVRSGLPNHLGRVIQRCLAKDPRERYQTALDVKNELVLLKRESSSRIDMDTRSALSASTAPASNPSSDPAMGPARVAAPPSKTHSWLPWAGGIALLAVIAGVWFLKPSGGGPEKDISAPAGALPAAASTVGKQSVVIFPFENLGAPEDAYFAAGMTEEITSRLAMVEGLSVMSRTSAVQYDKTGKTMPQIGKDLGVDYVLEGTVRWERKADGTSRVRVTPQLIKTADDSHAWAARYDKSMEEIFQVQSEIAEEVVRSLNVTLNPAEIEALDSRPTENLDAYHAYLRGLDLVNREYNPETWSLVLQLFERAVTLDPGFVLAHYAISTTHSGFIHFAWDRSPERLALAKASADRIMELDPGSPWAQMALGYYHYWGKKEYGPALTAFLAAEPKLGSNADVPEAIGNVRRRQGDYVGAVESYRKALNRDPRNPSRVWNVAETLTLVQDYAAADSIYDLNISLAPDVSIGYAGKWLNTVLWKGDTAGAREIVESCPVRSELSIQITRFLAAFCDRDFSAAREAAAALPRIEGEQFYYFLRSLSEAWALDAAGLPPMARVQYDSARVVIESEMVKDPTNARLRAVLGQAYAGLGRKEDAIREGRAAVELTPESLDAWIHLHRLRDLSFIYAAVGEPDAAMDILEDLLNRPGDVISPAYLRVHPGFDSLRKYPRFQQLAGGAL